MEEQKNKAIESELTGKESEEKIATENTQSEVIQMKEAIKKDKKTILYLTYLTTFARLPENRDLDELFDGEVQLGEEELMAVYSLIEIINGNNTITTLKAPKTMELDWNWAQDYKYNFSYENIEEKETRSEINGEKGKETTKGKRIKSIKGDGYGPFNETLLNFGYGKNNKINKILFERPTNLFHGENGGLGVDQEIKFASDREDGLITTLRIFRDYESDNKLSIQYNSIGKPQIVEQTKLGIMSDKILFEYDENGDLKTIFYMPVLSLKHLKGSSKTAKGGKAGKIAKVLKVSKEVGDLILDGIHITFKSIKMMDSCDIIEIENKDGLPVSTKTTLHSSRWSYENGFSKSDYNDKGELKQIYLEQEQMGPDDKRTIDLKY